MSLESENSKKLKDFFGREYRSLKVYVNTRIRDTANRDAEDIIQDVALKLFSGADRYAPINNVAGFVYRSIKNKIVDIMRANKPDAPIPLDGEAIDLTSFVNQPVNPEEKDAIIALLKANVEALKPGYRDIIIAIDFEGYTYREIAEETGIPEGTLMSRRHRAIGILYKQLESKINT